jgi:hypothetical protein
LGYRTGLVKGRSRLSVLEALPGRGEEETSVGTTFGDEERIRSCKLYV